VLDIRLVHVFGQLLELVAHCANEGFQENALIWHFLAWLGWQHWKGGTKTALLLLICEVNDLVSDRLDV